MTESNFPYSVFYQLPMLETLLRTLSFFIDTLQSFQCIIKERWGLLEAPVAELSPVKGKMLIQSVKRIHGLFCFVASKYKT